MTVSAGVEMLVRKPVQEIYESLVDPAITTRFWFTGSSGRLEPGARVRWEWEMYGASTQATVLALEADRRILIDWSDYDQTNRVEWRFTAPTQDTTFVSITNTGFGSDERTVVAQALDSTEGFTLVLAGLKALLEHHLMLNLVADRHLATNANSCYSRAGSIE